MLIVHATRCFSPFSSLDHLIGARRGSHPPGRKPPYPRACFRLTAFNTHTLTHRFGCGLVHRTVHSSCGIAFLRSCSILPRKPSQPLSVTHSQTFSRLSFQCTSVSGARPLSSADLCWCREELPFARPTYANFQTRETQTENEPIFRDRRRALSRSQAHISPQCKPTVCNSKDRSKHWIGSR